MLYYAPMDMFSALAEPTRRSIIEMLASRGQLSATAISRKFHVSPPAISQHLKVLREARLVRMEKRAQQRIYEINPDAMLELGEWAKRMAAQYERRFDALERILKAEESKTLKGREARRRRRRALAPKVEDPAHSGATRKRPKLRSRKEKQHGNSNQGTQGSHFGKNQAGR